MQEALSNAAKHADAAMLTVSVESDGTQLRIEIQDDGRGFDAHAAREYLREGRVGLASMRERVELASGTFVVRSSPGRGTTILATLPVDTPASDRELAVTRSRSAPARISAEGTDPARTGSGALASAGAAGPLVGDGEPVGDPEGDGVALGVGVAVGEASGKAWGSASAWR